MEERKRPAARRILLIVLLVIALLAALFPGRYINSAYGYMAFLFLLLVLIFSFLILSVLKKNVAVGSNTDELESVNCMRGDPLALNIRVENKSIFYCPHARAGFYISDLFGGTDSYEETDFTIAARSDSRFDFDMDMKHIGVYRVGLKNMEIYDMFGLWNAQVPIKGDFEVYVKPRIHSMEELHVEEEVLLDSSVDTRNAVPNGTDYVGVREYELGDSMKQIHWKLSAHSRTYLTKLSESSRQSDFAVVLDFSAYQAERQELMDLYDTLVETAFSILEELSHREVSYSLVYCDKQREMRRSVPQGRDTDMEFIRRFDVMTPDPEAGYPDGAYLMNQEGRMPNRSTNLILCTSRITTELIQEMLSIKQQKRSPELYLVIPDRLTQREREDLTAPLRQLDDMRIAWHLVSTSANAQKEVSDGEEES